MSVAIDARFHDLFTRKLLCAFTTLNANGQPHSVPVWCNYEDGSACVNVPVATKKARNLHSNNKLSLLIIDPDNGGHWIEIQGIVGEIRDETHGAREHINRLSEKYTGSPVYQTGGRDASEREMIVIEALKINGR